MYHWYNPQINKQITIILKPHIIIANKTTKSKLKTFKKIKTKYFELVHYNKMNC